ncbi:hypothetical protein BDAP_001560 [Binucleata daphniae]
MKIKQKHIKKLNIYGKHHDKALKIHNKTYENYILENITNNTINYNEIRNLLRGNTEPNKKKQKAKASKLYCTENIMLNNETDHHIVKHTDKLCEINEKTSIHEKINKDKQAENEYDKLYTHNRSEDDKNDKKEVVNYAKAMHIKNIEDNDQTNCNNSIDKKTACFYDEMCTKYPSIQKNANDFEYCFYYNIENNPMQYNYKHVFEFTDSQGNKI